MQINSTVAKTQISRILQAGLVPMLAGSPGIGKSDIARSVAEKFNLKLIDHRLSTSDPTDLSGFPAIVNGQASYIPFELFPIEGTELPTKEDGTPYDGWLLFLDEINSAPQSVQAAAYKLSLDRMVGQYNLHEKCAVMSAGNLESDGAIVNRLSTAMQSRLIHLELSVDSDEWLQWAYANNVDHRITSFINYEPGKLHQFDPSHNDKTFACPRTWAFLSRLIEGENDLGPNLMPAMEGTVSAGMAREFVQYCEIEKDLPSMAQIVKDPEGTDLPSEPSTNYFICGSLANHADKGNITALMKYIERMSIEFQIVCLRDMLKRKKELKKEKALLNWILTNSKELFD